MVNEGKDVTIIATGHLVWEAIKAAEVLAEEGIDAEIINIHTIKPLDTAAILKSVKKTKCVVTCEEHQANGGLGDAVAQTLSQAFLAPQEYIAVKDSFVVWEKVKHLVQLVLCKTANSKPVLTECLHEQTMV